MASTLEGVFPENLSTTIKNTKLLVVGAGGIGCELLKNLVLTGFHDIHVLDLDTIEVSNLNRQFLFRKEHVGKPKAIVAKDSALAFNPNANITAYHDSILESKYDVNFFKQFAVVLNALDNLAARSHVNRMCLAADLPLVESASAGFKGNVTCYKKNISECYNCTERPRPKTFPGCTIRNTPSEPIHCIVWAKHLFNQLFGQADEDQDVSPDSADPEAIANAGTAALNTEKEATKISTRDWAINHNYDGVKLFQKFFCDDIKYLLSMQNLWVTRRAPTPLEIDDLPDEVPSSSTVVSSSGGLKDQQVWSVAKCFEIFKECLKVLQQRFADGNKDPLIWDKDDDVAMDFVTACANIRCYIFGISQKSRFDTKSMAGNIIPAVASTNAIVAGLMVMLLFNVIQNRFDRVKTLYVSDKLNVRKELFASDVVQPPNPKCYVCKDKPEIALKIDVDNVNIRMLKEKVLQGSLNMVAPDVEIEGTGTLLLSSEEGESDDIIDKLLKDFGVKNGTRLVCDDFHQNYQLTINIIVMTDEEKEDHRSREEPYFQIIGDAASLKPKNEAAEEPAAKRAKIDSSEPEVADGDDLAIVGDYNGEDDLILLDDNDETIETPKKTPGQLPEKRPRSVDGEDDADDSGSARKAKQPKLSSDDVIELE